MSIIKNFRHTIIFLGMSCFIFILYQALFSSTRQYSTRLAEDIPTFELETIPFSVDKFTSTDLNGKLLLLNFWAPWCEACQLEHPLLMKIATQFHIPIFSVVYKDKEHDALTWLNQHGNPYVLTGDDQNGSVAIAFGIYGTPETFVISNGKIIYRHVGVLTQENWDNVIYPLIQKTNIQ